MRILTKGEVHELGFDKIESGIPIELRYQFLPVALRASYFAGDHNHNGTETLVKRAEDTGRLFDARYLGLARNPSANNANIKKAIHSYSWETAEFSKECSSFREETIVGTEVLLPMNRIIWPSDLAKLGLKARPGYLYLHCNARYIFMHENYYFTRHKHNMDNINYVEILKMDLDDARHVGNYLHKAFTLFEQIKIKFEQTKLKSGQKSRSKNCDDNELLQDIGDNELLRYLEVIKEFFAPERTYQMISNLLRPTTELRSLLKSFKIKVPSLSLDHAALLINARIIYEDFYEDYKHITNRAIFETPLEFPVGFVRATLNELRAECQVGNPLVTKFEQLIAEAHGNDNNEKNTVNQSEFPNGASNLIGPDRDWVNCSDPYFVQTLLLARAIGGDFWQYALGAIEQQIGPNYLN